MTAAEIEEQDYLAAVTARLRCAFERVHARVAGYDRNIREEKTYLWESKADMDGAEKAFTRQSIDQAILTGEAALDQRKRLAKLLLSPYFGRFDFVKSDQAHPEPVYVGIHHFADEADKKTLVYDWRAPISTMFYDHEVGPAAYEAPSGNIKGEIRLKRQFRIRNGRMEFMLETAVNIVDDILQEELSRASEDGMKQIVATIQREQNAIIRDDDAQELIIQGVAGSGKTSIALHRIAFLLYRFKDSVTSKDILIISPNRVFGDYISNVLPELGEEPVSEISMEALAGEILDYRHPFQTFLEQTTLLLENHDAAMRRRIEAKSSIAFLERLKEYAEHVERTCFSAVDVEAGGHLAPAALVEKIFRRHRGDSAKERLSSVVRAIEQYVGIRFNHDLTPAERALVRAKVRSMHRQSSLRATYKNMFAWMGEPALFKLAAERKLEYADVFPLIYLKLRLEGVRSPQRKIKHLLIDEMQDYTPVQYAVIASLFSCKKTILGDARQSVNPYSSSRAEEIQSVFRHASFVKLCKSYRSTYEISTFAQRISPDPDLIAVKRHGEEPSIVECEDQKQEAFLLNKLAREFRASAHNTLGMICKTQAQAQRLHVSLQSDGIDAHLLTAESASFVQGITVCTAHMAKGLEFDQVVVPEVSEQNYHTTMDRNLLYVACTRAMHRLTLTHTGNRTALIQ